MRKRNVIKAKLSKRDKAGIAEIENLRLAFQGELTKLKRKEHCELYIAVPLVNPEKGVRIVLIWWDSASGRAQLESLFVLPKHFKSGLRGLARTVISEARLRRGFDNEQTLDREAEGKGDEHHQRHC